MNKIFIVFFWTVLFIAQSLFAQYKLTLPNAIDSALSRNDKINRYKAKVMEMSARKEASIGNYLPKLSLYAGYTYFSENMRFNTSTIKNSLDDILSRYGVQIANGVYPLPPEIDSKIYTSLFDIFQKFPAYDLTIDQQQFPTAQLTLTQPIFTGGKIIAASDFSDARYKSAAYKLEMAKNEIIKETVSEYLGIALLKRVVEVRKQVVAGINKHKRVAVKLYAEGIIPKYYLLRADVALANAQLELEDDAHKLELAELALKSTLGFPEDTTVVLLDSLKFVDFNLPLDAALRQAETNQPILKIVDQLKEESELYKDLKQSKFLPDIFAYARYGFFLEDKPLIMPPWVLGVEMRLNIFNGFKDYNELEAAEYLTRQANFAKLEAEKKIKLWVNKTYRETANAKNKYLKMETTVRLAQENYKMVNKRFDQGMATSLEVVDAILTYQGAKIKRLSALYDYYKALIELNIAAGNPMEVVNLYN